MNKSNPYEIYKMYIGLKSHFNSIKYDYTKYGKSNAKLNSFLSRSDKIYFEKIAKMYNESDAYSLFVSNLLKDDSIWIGDLINEESRKIMIEWKKRNESPLYFLKEDLNKIINYMEKNEISFNNLFEVKQKNHPIILKMVLQNIINPETYVIFDLLLNFNSEIDKFLKNDIIWNALNTKYKKYGSLLNYTKEDKNIFRKNILSAFSQYKYSYSREKGDKITLNN